MLNGLRLNVARKKTTTAHRQQSGTDAADNPAFGQIAMTEKVLVYTEYQRVDMPWVWYDVSHRISDRTGMAAMNISASALEIPEASRLHTHCCLSTYEEDHQSK